MDTATLALRVEMWARTEALLTGGVPPVFFVSKDDGETVCFDASLVAEHPNSLTVDYCRQAFALLKARSVAFVGPIQQPGPEGVPIPTLTLSVSQGDEHVVRRYPKVTSTHLCRFAEEDGPEIKLSVLKGWTQPPASGLAVVDQAYKKVAKSWLKTAILKKLPDGF